LPGDEATPAAIASRLIATCRKLPAEFTYLILTLRGDDRPRRWRVSPGNPTREEET
jgi:hypothetical protein